MLENTEAAIKKENPEKLATQRYTRHRTNKCQRIPKEQSKRKIQRNWQHRGTQETGQINVREYRRGNQTRKSRETGNIGYTRHRTNKYQRIPKRQSKMDNPEKLAIQGTQDTGQINVREYRRGNQKWTIQRNWQHRVHKTQDK